MKNENDVISGLSYLKKMYGSEKCDLEKSEAFDKIAGMFYNQNFGATSKAEIELMMFSIFMDMMIKKNQNDDEVLDYNACSDYEIGRMLGIPQEKVRNLKIKKQARYPKEFNWEKSLLSIKDRIVYDETKQRIIIPMPDPNLYNEIRNFIENNGGYIEIQRGNNVIQIRPHYLFMLFYYKIDNEKEREKLRKSFAKELKKRSKKESINDIVTDAELSKYALELGNDTFRFVLDVVECTSNPLMCIFKGLRVITKVIKKNL